MNIKILENKLQTILENDNFKITKEFIERGKISLDKEYDGDKAFEIYANLQKDIQKERKKRDRER